MRTGTLTSSYRLVTKNNDARNHGSGQPVMAPNSKLDFKKRVRHRDKRHKRLYMKSTQQKKTKGIKCPRENTCMSIGGGALLNPPCMRKANDGEGHMVGNESDYWYANDRVTGSEIVDADSSCTVGCLGVGKHLGPCYCIQDRLEHKGA